MTREYETEWTDCPRCDGVGVVEYGDFFMRDEGRCTYCFGSGEIEVCANCYDEDDGCTVCNPPMLRTTPVGVSEILKSPGVEEGTE